MNVVKRLIVETLPMKFNKKHKKDAMQALLNCSKMWTIVALCGVRKVVATHKMFPEEYVTNDCFACNHHDDAYGTNSREDHDCAFCVCREIWIGKKNRLSRYAMCERINTSPYSKWKELNGFQVGVDKNRWIKDPYDLQFFGYLIAKESLRLYLKLRDGK